VELFGGLQVRQEKRDITRLRTPRTDALLAA